MHLIGSGFHLLVLIKSKNHRQIPLQIFVDTTQRFKSMGVDYEYQYISKSPHYSVSPKAFVRVVSMDSERKTPRF